MADSKPQPKDEGALNWLSNTAEGWFRKLLEPLRQAAGQPPPKPAPPPSSDDWKAAKKRSDDYVAQQKRLQQQAQPNPAAGLEVLSKKKPPQ